MTTITDTRMRRPDWSAAASGPAPAAAAIRFLLVATVPLALFYFAWLLQPRAHRPAGPVRAAAGRRGVQPGAGGRLLVDVRARAPVRAARCATAAPPPRSTSSCRSTTSRSTWSSRPSRAAARMRGADVRVLVLDDGDSDEMRRDGRSPGRGLPAPRRPLRRQGRATSTTRCARTDAPFVVVLDCDHVPGALPRGDARPLRRPSASRSSQTPQYYANADAGDRWPRRVGASRRCSSARSRAARTAWARCSAAAPTSCSGARRSEDVGGFPERLGHRGLRAVDPAARARLAHAPTCPRSLASRARPGGHGVLRQPAAALGARLPGGDPRPRCAPTLPLRQKVQYLLSSSYFLSGWTVLVYMSVPVVRHPHRRPAAGGDDGRPVPRSTSRRTSRSRSAWWPSLGAGAFTFAGFALATSSFWIHVRASLLAVPGAAAGSW